uniref:ATP synthase F0 subunit 8 n=1 Tax=Anoplodactylus australis TaxID=2992006 RepID=A0A9E7V797_9CHEL|nr:ATP synthase F0 subunit 8 [Anoplodactylus australis]UZA61238.1 ATP synthase F0 subunit 8 [Anoplodactylus australis]
MPQIMPMNWLCIMCWTMLMMLILFIVIHFIYKMSPLPQYPKNFSLFFYPW